MSRSLLSLSLAVFMLTVPVAGQIGGLSSLAELKDYRARRVSSNNPDPASNDDSLRPTPGETVTLADLRGPGVVTHMWVTVAASEYGWPRLLRLRVYYDGSATPSVDAPLGDFFGVGHGFEREINSQVVRNSSSGRSRNSYWPMPFRKSCKITVTNEGRQRVSNLYYHVDWREVPALAADTAYLHAWYHQELDIPRGRTYTILDVKGRGHYVGTVFNVIQNEAGWFGEGDDQFYVDGDKVASIQGTGTEDYFNDAWSLRVAEGPFAGVPVAEGTGVGSRMSAYRWHLPDPIPFRTSLKFDMENAGWTYNSDGSVRSAFEGRSDLFSSVAFWYQVGVAQGLPRIPYGASRLPHANARQSEVENQIGDVKTSGGAAEVQREVFWSRHIIHFKARGEGAKIEIPFDVANDGRYELIAQVAHAPDYGIYSVLIDGKPAGGPELEHEPGANMGGAGTIDAYHTELYVAQDHLLAWQPLTRGRHTVTFVCVGKNMAASGHNLGIDTLVVAKIGEHAETPAPDNPAGRPIAEVIAALSDPSAITRGLAAIALRDRAREAAPALPPLIEHLRDADENVRMLTAQAIGAQGANAARAVPELMAACRVKGEHVHVLRSLASALGAVGPAARDALPVLRELERIPRVRWNARWAIAHIEAPARANVK